MMHGKHQPDVMDTITIHMESLLYSKYELVQNKHLCITCIFTQFLVEEKGVQAVQIEGVMVWRLYCLLGPSNNIVWHGLSSN